MSQGNLLLAEVAWRAMDLPCVHRKRQWGPLMNQLCAFAGGCPCSAWLLFHTSALKAEFPEDLTFISVAIPRAQPSDGHILGP